MYSEDYEVKEKRGFPLKDFLLKLILIIIFVLLLMWLIPWPNNKVLTDRIFNANIQEMKGASLLYFTKERLPINVGDKKTITLQQMLDLKLLLPFTDKNGKSCDVQKSYVTIEKLENEYLLKVYLSCDNDEDYILVHVGCYAYCTTEVCEKKEDPKATATPKPGKPTPKPTSNPKPTPTSTATPPPTEKPGEDSNPSCSLSIVDGIIDPSDNKYISNVTIGWGHKSSTNGATITNFGLGYSLNYKGSNTFLVTNNGTTTVYGYVKDSKGKVASCSISVTKKDKVIPPDVEYIYQYKKDIPKQYSAWGAWSPEKVYVDADNIRFGNFELLQVENLGARKELVGYKPYYLTYRIKKPVYVGSYEQVKCAGYSYVTVDNSTYAVGDWVRTNDISRGPAAPESSASVDWRFESIVEDTCRPCSDQTIIIWRKYVRTTTPTGSNSVGGVVCTDLRKTMIPLYGIQTTTETREVRVNVYAYVKYYRYRERTMIKDTYPDYQWASTDNDSKLIGQGYTYTGVKKIKE